MIEIIQLIFVEIFNSIMEKNYKFNKILKLAIAVLFTGVFGSASAQLSGTYTLDSTAATGGTNFKTWVDFSTSITTNGVNGAVVLNVVTDRIETAQVTFGAISGASSTNTVTINGGGKVLSAAVADAVVLMNGADYVTFNKLVIRNTTTSQYAQGFRFQNASDYNTISNNTIEFTAMATGSTAGGAYVSFASSGTAIAASVSTYMGAYNTISGNLMRTTNAGSPGPTYGIMISGNSLTYSSTAQNNTISNNTIENFYYMGIRMLNTNGNQVLKNDISRANSASNNCNSTIYGIYSDLSYGTSRATKLDGNNLHDWPYSGASASNAPSTLYGFYLNNNYGTSSIRFSVSNNNINKMRASSNLYLGYSTYSYYLDLIGNGANDDDVTVSTSSGYNFYGWNMNYNYYSYRMNSNTIQNCDGGYYFYGIFNNNPSLAGGVMEINDNVIQNNANSYYYTYYIYSYNAQNSNSSYPIEINRNQIKKNSTVYYNTRFIYCYNYGFYKIYDNVMQDNVSTYYMYAMDLEYYGSYDIQRNKIINNRATLNSNGYYYGIYLYYNYDVEINHNLLVDNIGYYSTYAWYIYGPFSGNYKADFIQNTVKIDGTGTYQYQYVYLYGLTYYSNVCRYIGNIFEVKNCYYASIYFYNYNQLQIRDNSYYMNNLNGGMYFATVTGGSSTVASWIASGIGTNEIEALTGHNFATNYASIRYFNQNNVANYAVGAKDAYLVARNPSRSDRGAVEGTLDIAQTVNSFNPPSPVCAGYTTSPTLTFKNNFADAVTGFRIGMSDNGVLRATATMTNTIAIGGTNTVTFAPIQFSQSGAHRVKFFLLNADDVPSNDTITYNFTVLKSPGGATLTQNTVLSSVFAQYKTDSKPDLTFPDEKMVYNLSNPTTLPYSNSDYQGQGGGNKWVASVSAKTINGFPATSTVSGTFNSGYRVTLDAPKAWEDSTIEISIKVNDLITGCDTIYKRKILIGPKAVPAAKIPTILCEKSELYFESMSSVSSGSIDYTWDFGDGTPVTNDASPVHTFASKGTYNVKLTTTTNPFGFVTSKTFPVVVKEIPSAIIVNTNACSGSAVKLDNGTKYSGTGVITYVWDYGDGSGKNTTTSAAQISKSYPAPGGYNVTLTASADGCVNTVKKVVYQFAKPIANFAKVSGSCLNSEFSFANYSAIPNGQFGNLWDFDDAGNKATLKEPTYNFVTAGTKQVKLKVISEFGCTDSITVPVLVKQIPTTNFTFPFACSRTATPFVNTTSLNGEALKDYSWDFGDGFSSAATSPIKNWTSIGPRIVKLTTNLMNGCSTTESKQINVGVQPNVNFQVEDRCAGSEVPFANSTTFSQGTVVYTWFFGDGNKSNAQAPVHVYGSTVSQTYTVKLKAEVIGGCADSLSKTVTIQPLPTTCSFDITGGLNAAKTAPVNFVPTGGATSGITYTWITGDGNSVTSNGTGASYTYVAPGKYCVTMTARNIAGCECTSTKCVGVTTDIRNAESMNNAVSVFPNPNSGIFNVTLTAEISTDMTVNVYNTIGELVKTVVVNGNSTSVDLTDFASGIYTVKVIADNQIATKKITVTR
jgi:parallel beta-helix repeat protein